MNIHEQISTSIKFCQSLFAWYTKTTSKPEIKTKEKNSNKNVDKRKKRREKKKNHFNLLRRIKMHTVEHSCISTLISVFIMGVLPNLA